MAGARGECGDGSDFDGRGVAGGQAFGGDGGAAASAGLALPARVRTVSMSQYPRIGHARISARAVPALHLPQHLHLRRTPDRPPRPRPSKSLPSPHSPRAPAHCECPQCTSSPRIQRQPIRRIDLRRRRRSAVARKPLNPIAGHRRDDPRRRNLPHPVVLRICHINIPAASTANAVGRSSRAPAAAPPSPKKPATPDPAIVAITPVAATPRAPCDCACPR